MRRFLVVLLFGACSVFSSAPAFADCDAADPTCDDAGPGMTPADSGGATTPPVTRDAGADAFDPGFGTSERAGDSREAVLPDLPADDPGCDAAGADRAPLFAGPVAIGL